MYPEVCEQYTLYFPIETKVRFFKKDIEQAFQTH